MKKPKTAGLVSPIPPTGKRGTNPIAAEPLDKQTSAGDFEKMRKAEKFRPQSVDVNHRFGKRSGST